MDLIQKHKSIKKISTFLGLLAWTIQAVPCTQAHYNLSQNFMNRSLEHFDFNKELQLPEEVKEEIRWWIRSLSMINGKFFCITEPDIIIYSYASLSGWGACSDGVITRGPWSNEDY